MVSCIGRRLKSIVLTTFSDTRSLDALNSPPTPPPAPDSRTHILAEEDLVDCDQFLDGFDKGTTTYQAQDAAEDPLPPTFFAFGTPALQPTAETSSALYPENPYNYPHNFTYAPSEGQGAAPLFDLYRDEGMLAQTLSDRHYQHTSRRCTYGDLDSMTHTRDMYQGDRSIQSGYNRADENDPGISPGLDGSRFPVLQNRTFFGGREIIDRMYSAVSQPQGMRPEFSTPRILPYGSDSGFSVARFISPANQEAVVQRDKTMLETLGCLEPSDSAASTRPSSPTTERRKLPEDNGERKSQTKFPAVMITAESKSRHRKTRAKVNGVGKSHLDDPPSHAKKGKSPLAKKAKVTKKQSIDSLSSETSRSRSGDLKSPRENLSEEQKKLNHINSEQRRRDAIRDAFDNLLNIVPSLRSENASRAIRVDHAIRWLEELLDGNEELKRRLSAI